MRSSHLQFKCIHSRRKHFGRSHCVVICHHNTVESGIEHAITVTSTMYAVTPLKSPPKSAYIEDGPVLSFVDTIEHTKPEQWQKRTMALQQLVSGIPDEITGVDTMWYNSPKYIRHLAFPLSELLKDPRSSVVKRTADSCTLLFTKCGADARYLLKDLMPTILAVHAQTVQVIRNAVLEMMMESLPLVPCKSVMPLLLERLNKNDKSRTVREACAVYLTLALESWTDEGYLTDDIWFQVGTSLIRALRDASPSVRNEAKRGVEYTRVAQSRQCGIVSLMIQKVLLPRIPN